MNTLFTNPIVRSMAAGVSLVFGLSLSTELLDEALMASGMGEVKFSTRAYAQVTKNPNCGKKSNEPRRTHAMSEKMNKELSKASAFAQPEPETEGAEPPPPNFPAAKAELVRILKRCEKDDCKKNELGTIYNYLGWINYSLEDYDGAIKAYENLVAQAPEVLIETELQTYLTLARLALQTEKLDISLKYVNKWLSTSCDEDPDVYQLRSNVYYFQDDKVNALKDISRAVKMVEDAGKIPKEPWWSLEMSLLLQKEEYRASLPILIKMVRHYPSIATWHRLASVYGVLEQGDNQRHALDAIHTMGGFTKENHYINLVSLYTAAEYPWKAAKLMQEGMDKKIVRQTTRNLQTLAQTYAAAQELDRSIPVMEKAAELAESGDLYALLVNLYLNKDDYTNAVISGERAIEKKNIRRAGEVHLNMGIAYFEQKKYESAVESFKEAKKYDATSRLADNWMRHATNEWEREKHLKEALELES